MSIISLLMTAAPDPTNLPPRMLLNATGAAGPATIMRVHPDGSEYPVRAADPAPFTGGLWVGYDYEAPFGLEVTYYFTDTGLATVSAPAILDPQVPWLIHPGLVSMSVPLNVQSRGPSTRATTQGVHAPLGRKTPIVITDGVRKAATFDLTVSTSTLEDEAALDALLDLDATMLLQISYADVRRSLYEWVSVGDAVATPTKAFGSEYMTWALPCTITDSPVGRLQSQRTWADLPASFATWDQVTSTFASWAGLLTNTPGA